MASVGERFNVLLVEDNEADVGLTVAALRDALIPSKVHVVRDGEEALEFLKRTGKHAEAEVPDLILLDLNLPKMDGFEVLESMRSDPKLKHLPVIVTSGSAREEDEARAYRLHISAYVVKPTDKDKYFSAIRSIKELWFHSVALPPKENETSA